MILWTYDPAERDARLANEALKSKKKGINQLQVIVEIACASTPHHLVAVRQTYCSLFDSSLEEDIIANVSLPVRKVKSLLSLSPSLFSLSLSISHSVLFFQPFSIRRVWLVYNENNELFEIILHEKKKLGGEVVFGIYGNWELRKLS